MGKCVTWMCVEWMRICGEMSDMDVCGVANICITVLFGGSWSEISTPRRKDARQQKCCNNSR